MYNIKIINEENNVLVNTSVKCNNIEGNTINAEQINVNSMNVNDLSSNNITVNDLSSNTITVNDLSSNNITVNDINLNGDIYSNNFSYIPVGSILTYSGIIEPSGWFLCDGREVSKTLYSRLYAVIGDLYGTPLNNNNFVLPNLGERVPVGKNNSNNIGNTGGNSSITLSIEQLPSHSHTGTTNTNGNHSHSINDPGHSHSQWTHQDDFNEFGGNPPSFTDDAGGTSTWYNINSSSTGITINSNGSHTHTFTTNTTGNGNSIDIRNKFIVLNYIIRY